MNICNQKPWIMKPSMMEFRMMIANTCAKSETVKDTIMSSKPPTTIASTISSLDITRINTVKNQRRNVASTSVQKPLISTCVGNNLPLKNNIPPVIAKLIMYTIGHISIPPSKRNLTSYHDSTVICFLQGLARDIGG